MENGGSISCPFCGFSADGDYQIMLHMETLHPEDGESPFIVKDDASIAALAAMDEETSDEYASCPVEGCGEAILLTELDMHIEMHEEEVGGENSSDLGQPSKRLKLDPGPKATFDTKLSHALRNLPGGDDPQEAKHAHPEKSPDRRSADPQASTKAAWKALLKMPDSSSKPGSSKRSPRRRLGKSELGPHAHEKQMPAWLVKLLTEEDGVLMWVKRVNNDGREYKFQYCRNMAGGVVQVVEQLLDQDKGVQFAYMCDYGVKHISKLRREGGFCGYRNIQSLCSYIIRTRSQGHEIFQGKIPTIFQIQEYIESAWDAGINVSGRIETGGIRGTRKYIGTPDVSLPNLDRRAFAQAMFCFLGIACDAQGIKPKNSPEIAYEILLDTVEQYFMSGCMDYNPKVRRTGLPPIYFQHPGHSMTIVGIEKKTDGTRNLIVFDPMFHESSDFIKLVGNEFKHPNPEGMLKAYRRGSKYLKRYTEFELLKLTPPAPSRLQRQKSPGSAGGPAA